MNRLLTRTPRFAGLLALALGAAALMALPGVALAKHHQGRDHHHGRHGSQFAHQTAKASSLEEEAGTISSFDATTGKLTIALAGGESLTALVTEDTEIKCGGITQSGDHGEEPGDDNGEQGEEPGDDSGGDSGHSWSDEEEAGEVDGESCGPESLTVGTVVSGAELRLENGSVVFKEIDLGMHS